MPYRRQAIPLTNSGLDYWRIYGLLCLNEFKDTSFHSPRCAISTLWDRDQRPPLFRRHFHIHFLVRKFLYFCRNFNEICFEMSIQHCGRIGADKNLALKRWQAIICTSDGLFYRSIYVSLDLDDLIQEINVAIPFPRKSIDRRYRQKGSIITGRAIDEYRYLPYARNYTCRKR